MSIVTIAVSLTTVSRKCAGFASYISKPVLDPPLTDLGRKQASSLAPELPNEQAIVDLVVTSPLRRTLETTLLGWGPAVNRLGVENVICLPAAQECNDFPCDTGSSRADLEKISEYAGLDFSLLTPDWNSKTGFWAADPQSLAHRAKTVRHFLRDRPEKEIVLVAHGDFLRRITADAEGPSGYMWRNVEVQVWKFDESSVDEDECFLRFEEEIEKAGGWDPTSSEMEASGGAFKAKA